MERSRKSIFTYLNQSFIQIIRVLLTFFENIFVLFQNEKILLFNKKYNKINYINNQKKFDLSELLFFTDNYVCNCDRVPEETMRRKNASEKVKKKRIIHREEYFIINKTMLT